MESSSDQFAHFIIARGPSLYLLRESFLQVHKLNNTKKWAKWNEGQLFLSGFFLLLFLNANSSRNQLIGGNFRLVFFLFFRREPRFTFACRVRDKFKCKWTIERAVSCELPGELFFPLEPSFFFSTFSSVPSGDPGSGIVNRFSSLFYFFLVLCFIYILASWLWFSFSFFFLF